MAFQFADPGPLVDQEFALLAPSEQWIEALLAACHHPLTCTLAPDESVTTRQSIRDFLAVAPHGRQPADARKGWVPTYHFWMHSSDPSIPIRIVGGIGLRIGESFELQTYSGHIGYHVYPPARGRHYAERAARLLLPLARAHGLRDVWITCNPDNFASRRTCERLGATFIDVVHIPPDHPFFARGERAKCRYLIQL